MDDELPGLTYLKMLCEQIPELDIIKAYNNPLAFISDLPGLDFDLVMLDIEMPGMRGLEVANLLPGKAVVFITAYKEYAAEAFDVGAFDYVRKPVKKERLQQAVMKVIKQLSYYEKEKDFFQLNTDLGKAIIYFDQLNIIEASDSDSRDKIAYLNNGTILKLKNISFDRLLDLLPAEQFCRINKKEIVAIRCVQVFSFDEITTNVLDQTGKNLKLTIGDAYRNDFMKLLNK